jgi:long-chain fatty acid transport protein
MERLSLAIAIVALACAPQATLAGSGFLLRSQSATTLGTAQAGMAAEAEDVSTIVFNPALLALAQRAEAVVGVTPIFSRGHFDPESATTILGTPIGGGNGGNSAKTGYPLNVHLARPLNAQWTAGFSLTSFHGLGFDWDDGWVGRYHAGESELLTLDLVPSLAWRPLPALALGAGIDVRYARAKTTTAVDFGTAAAAATGSPFVVPAGNDGSLHTRLDDWGVGAIVGAMYEPADGTRLGASYRSQIHVTLTGSATYDLGGPVGEAVAAATGQFRSGDARAALTFPAALIVGVEQRLSPKTWLLASAQWTQWSKLDALRLRFADQTQAGVDTELRWRDSWFVALGVRHRVDDRWTLRGGVAYDQTPSRRDTSTPAIPDASGTWTDVGASYAFDPANAVDFAYGHIFVRDNPIALSASQPGSLLRGNLAGTIRGSAVDFIGLQYRRRF